MATIYKRYSLSAIAEAKVDMNMCSIIISVHKRSEQESALRSLVPHIAENTTSTIDETKGATIKAR
jgi:Rad3-related DNA helicase